MPPAGRLPPRLRIAPPAGSHTPAFVRDFGVGELGTGASLFRTDVYLGERPPLLPDFLDDDVAARVDVPIVQKLIVVQGMELSPLA
jgi:hypothetical protein